MNGITCDMCGNELLIGEDVRYVSEIQVYAAYDPLEITASDLKKDFRSAISALIKKMKLLSPKRAQNSVYRAFSFDLCCKCQKKYLENPLPTEPQKGKTNPWKE